MGDFEIDWLSEDDEVALKVIGKEASQIKLAEIAKKTSSRPVRIAAIKKLTGQDLLTGLAKSDKDCEVRDEASRRLAFLRSNGL
ncbi:MAG: hypothetical protein FWD52_05685 [Candidatus Bathyarchaeota archaeon]|nr:hypothetical protein [Candidatus Termiticorpusculum sp.]